MQDIYGKPIFFAGAETESAMRRSYFDAIIGCTNTKEGVDYYNDLYYKILKETIEDEKPQIDLFLTGDYKKLSKTEENEIIINSLINISNDIIDEKLDTYDDLETLNAIKNILMLDNLYKHNTPLKHHVTDPQKLLNECNTLISQLTKKTSEKR